MGGKEDHLWQPCSRRDCNKYIEGVDNADQLNGYYSTLQKAKNYLWRGVFEQKLMQACTNAWLLFRWWLQVIVAKVNVEVELHRYPLSTVRRVLAARPCTGLRKWHLKKVGPRQSSTLPRSWTGSLCQGRVGYSLERLQPTGKPPYSVLGVLLKIVATL